MSATEVLRLCRGALVIVSRVGAQVELKPVFPEVGPVPDSLIDQVREHKPEILRLLEHEESADALVLDSTRRIGAGWIPGRPLEGPKREAHEMALRDCYWQGDPDRLEMALRAREDYAYTVFNRYRSEVMK